jgi:glycosyltransferase involved in cell wall biosynthesis
MTFVEAAAMGAPSVLAEEVGAAKLLNDACIKVEMLSSDSLPPIHELESILKKEQLLEEIGKNAKTRALEWDEVAYGKALIDLMRGVAYNF